MEAILCCGVGLRPDEGIGAGQHGQPSPAAASPGSAGCAGAAPGPSDGQNGHSSSLGFGADFNNASLSSALLARPWVTLSVTLMLKQKQALQDSLLKSFRIIIFKHNHVKCKQKKIQSLFSIR